MTRTSQIRMVERRKFFQCSNAKCGWQFAVNIEVEQDNTLDMPKVCPSINMDHAAAIMAPPDDEGGGGGSSFRGGGGKGKGSSKKCTSSSFKEVPDMPAIKADYQEVKIQEPVQSLAVGSIPRSIVVVLEDDLVDVLKAGE